MRVGVVATAILLAVPFAPPVAAQAAGLTFAQVQSRYPTMNAVHIRKCDYDGDGIYPRVEMACVQGIYQSLYITR